MSDNKSTAGDDVLIGRDHWDVPVSVELRAYLNFGRRMDSQLRRLVTRWAHAASPQARKSATDSQETDRKRQNR
jgi:hypothetical protein